MRCVAEKIIILVDHHSRLNVNRLFDLMPEAVVKPNDKLFYHPFREIVHRVFFNDNQVRGMTMRFAARTPNILIFSDQSKIPQIFSLEPVA